MVGRRPHPFAAEVPSFELPVLTTRDAMTETVVARVALADHGVHDPLGAVHRPLVLRFPDTVESFPEDFCHVMGGIFLAMAVDKSLLEAALIGYRVERARLTQTIADLEARIGGGASSNPPAKRPKRKMSAAARKRIGAAQRKRWTAFRKKQLK